MLWVAVWEPTSPPVATILSTRSNLAFPPWKKRVYFTGHPLPSRGPINLYKKLYKYVLLSNTVFISTHESEVTWSSKVSTINCGVLVGVRNPGMLRSTQRQFGSLSYFEEMQKGNLLARLSIAPTLYAIGTVGTRFICFTKPITTNARATISLAS